MSARQEEMAREYGLNMPGEPPTLPAPELFPKKPAYVVRQHDGARWLDVMSWGFPRTVTGKSGKPLEKAVTNVREYASPFWRSALGNPERRCLVPFTAFSEYGPGVPGKLPLHWFEIPSRPIASFAGIWRPLGEGRAYAFLTCDPNALVAPVHPRAMPVILHAEDYDRWLEAPIADAITLASPYPSQLMVMDA